MDYKIIDNFLPIEQHNLIKQTLLGCDFPWYYNIGINYEFENITYDEKYNCQFTHTFFRQNVGITSQFFPLVDAIKEKIDPFLLIRVKANLNFSTEKQIRYNFHVDMDDFYGRTAVYYVNTNNGKTFFEDGTTIDSIANRLLIFDSSLRHTGSTCTDEKVRCLININYYEKNKIYKSI